MFYVEESDSASSSSRLSRLLENHAARAGEDTVNDVTLLEAWYTPPEAPGKFLLLHTSWISRTKMCISHCISHCILQCSSMYLTASPGVSLTVSQCISHCFSLYFSVYLSLCLSLYLSVYQLYYSMCIMPPVEVNTVLCRGKKEIMIFKSSSALSNEI